MGDVSVEALLEYLRHRGGAGLRFIGWYGSDEYEVHYVRDDLDPEVVFETADAYVTRLRDQPSAHRETLDDQLGSQRASVGVRDDAVVINFPRGNDRGVVVSLEPETIESLHSFITDCTTRLQSDEPPASELRQQRS